MIWRLSLLFAPLLLADAPAPVPCRQDPRQPPGSAAVTRQTGDLLTSILPSAALGRGLAACDIVVPRGPDERRDVRDDVLYGLPRPDLSTVIPAPFGH